MSEDDRPFRGRAKVIRISGNPRWDDDRRAEVGAELRRIERDRARSGASIPLPDITDDPIELTGPTEQVEESEVLTEIWSHINRAVERLDAGRRQTSNQVMELAAGSGPSAVKALQDKVSAMERTVRVLVGLLIAALTAAGGSLVAVGRGLYDRGAHEGGDAIRLDHVERAVDRMRDDIRALDERMGRHSSLIPTAQQKDGEKLLTATKEGLP